MNKNFSIPLAILALVVIAGGALLFIDRPHTAAAEAAVREQVIEFGSQLQKVSLLSPDAGNTIGEMYGPYVDAELLAQWQKDPASAPGRQTSSPWPDHIDITGVTENGDGTYAVSGSLVLMTSTEAAHGGNAGTYPVTITLDEENGVWKITSYVRGSMATESERKEPEGTAGSNNDASDGGSSASPSIHLTSLSPESGPVGTTVAFAGSGFDATSQVRIGNGAIRPVSVNDAGTVLTITMPDGVGAYCRTGQACPLWFMLLQPGTYQLYVENDDGAKSAAFDFTLTGTTTLSS